MKKKVGKKNKLVLPAESRPSMRTRISLLPKSFAKNEPISVAQFAVLYGCRVQRAAIGSRAKKGKKDDVRKMNAQQSVAHSLGEKKSVQAKGFFSVLMVKEGNPLKEWRRVVYAKT